MTIRPELIDELLKECSDPREVLAEGGLTKAIIERCLETELDVHLGYPKHGRREDGSDNARNGTSRKKLKGAQGQIEIAVPRDRQASFEPQFIQKHQTRLDGFEDKILTLSACGMTTRDIQAQVQDLYGVEVSPTLFWLSVFTELQNRGVKDIFIACVDGLTGLPEAIESLYPQTRVQLCIVHLVRNSLKYVSSKCRIFPSDEAVFKVVYLAIQNIARKWTMPIHNWKPALHCFAIEFAGRLPQ